MWTVKIKFTWGEAVYWPNLAQEEMLDKVKYIHRLAAECDRLGKHGFHWCIEEQNKLS